MYILYLSQENVFFLNVTLHQTSLSYDLSYENYSFLISLFIKHHCLMICLTKTITTAISVRYTVWFTFGMYGWDVCLKQINKWMFERIFFIWSAINIVQHSPLILNLHSISQWTYLFDCKQKKYIYTPFSLHSKGYVFKNKWCLFQNHLCNDK